MSKDSDRRARLHRMVMPGHVCPYGLKSRWLLQRKGFEVDDRWLRTRAETDAFKEEHGVETTPQTFIDGRRIGGYDELRKYFGLKVRDEDDTSYTPVLAVFAVAALLAVATLWPALAVVPLAERFIAIGMCLLAMLKLQDVEQFSSMFLNYDLLGRRTQARYADNSHTVAYVWDAAGRLTSTAAGGKTLAYQKNDAVANAIGLTCFVPFSETTQS